MMTAAVAVLALFVLDAVAWVDAGDMTRQPQTTNRTTCVRNPLLSDDVHASSYDLGCEEIDELLKGEKVFLGYGGVRNVYLVDHKGKSLVVKTLRAEDDPKRRYGREKMSYVEVVALNAVGCHPNVVGLLGLCNTTIVTEYLSASLSDMLLRPEGRLPLSAVIPMALDAARGLQALHEAPGGPVVHFDLKPAQLLLDENRKVKINDLNKARLMEINTATGDPCPFGCRPRTHFVPWRAPENMAGYKNLTEKVDIYSMGMIFFSLTSGKLPFDEDEHPANKALAGEKPAFDAYWPAGYMKLVQDMWCTEPKERPSAAQVVARLEAF